jgi:hypothetical protein
MLGLRMCFFFVDSGEKWLKPGVGVFVGRKNNCAFLALAYMRGRREGTDVFCLFSIQKFIAEAEKEGASTAAAAH